MRGKNRGEAEESVKELGRKFNESKARVEKEKIWRATQEEANRAGVSATDMRNGEAARMRQREVETIFRSEAARMHRELFH